MGNDNLGKLKNLISEFEGDFKFSSLDKVLSEMTYQELVDVIYSNEKNYDEQTVMRVFRELMDIKIQEAKSTIKRDMSKILDMLNDTKED